MTTSTTAFVRACCLCLVGCLSAPAALFAQESGFEFDRPPRQNPEKKEPAPFPAPKIRQPPSILPPILWAAVAVAVVFISIRLLIVFFDRRNRQRGWSCPHCRGSGIQWIAQADNDNVVRRKCPACSGKGTIKV